MCIVMCLVWIAAFCGNSRRTWSGQSSSPEDKAHICGSPCGTGDNSVEIYVSLLLSTLSSAIFVVLEKERVFVTHSHRKLYRLIEFEFSLWNMYFE